MAGVIEEYLSATKTGLSDSKRKFHVVLGNEACDLDSAACAISLAYFLHATEDKQTLHVPMLNIEKSEYRLKTEVKYLLNKIGVKESSLVFKEDLDLKSLCSNGKLKLSLVDFNAFPKEQEYLNKCIVQVIDHHVSKQKGKSKAKIIIEVVGSCATLVTELITKNSSFNVTKDLAMLLYGAILVDTAFFKDKNKTTQKDVTMGKYLSDLIPNINSKDYYSEILEAKLDDSELSQLDVLMKDLKILKKTGWHKSLTIAISVVQNGIFEFFNFDTVLENLFTDFLKNSKADILIIMFIQVLGDAMARYMAIFSQKENLLKMVCDVLKGETNPSLGLEQIMVLAASPTESVHKTQDGSEDMSKRLHSTSLLTVGSILSTPSLLSSFFAFKQTNVAASRKVVIPILDKHLDDFLKCV